MDSEQAAKVRKLNKTRSKDMERTVTKRLNGDRVPMSGAGFIKGDGIVYLPDNQGFMSVECKLSGGIGKYGPQILFIEKWIGKLQQDCNSMRGIGCKFGFFILKYMFHKEMWCIFLDEDLSKFEQYFSAQIKEREGIHNLDTKKGVFKMTHLTLQLVSTHGRMITGGRVLRVIPFSEVERIVRNVET